MYFFVLDLTGGVNGNYRVVLKGESWCHGLGAGQFMAHRKETKEGNKHITSSPDSPLPHPQLRWLHDYCSLIAFLESAILSALNPINLPSIPLKPGVASSGPSSTSS